jgi:hypothetical protein
VRSRNKEYVVFHFARGVWNEVADDCGYCRNYSINQRSLFDENYGLASTQALKNKDIPEGGAKGTILPSYVNILSYVLQKKKKN